MVTTLILWPVIVALVAGAQGDKVLGFGGAPKTPAQPLQTDADAIAKAKQAKLMQSMAASGRAATDLTGQSDKMGG